MQKRTTGQIESPNAQFALANQRVAAAARGAPGHGQLRDKGETGELNGHGWRGWMMSAQLAAVRL